MSRVLIHRGPDDFGYLYASTESNEVQLTQHEHSDFAPNVLLAHRRLAITDLSTAGRQPMANVAGDIFVVFNGAIHNYLELRQELKKLGHAFHTKTDTEILLRAYEEWGAECATRFNGMWSYVIWDHRNHRLVCSRDRFGIKPFFTATIGDTFYFASEAKAILAVERSAREPNLGYIRHIFTTYNPHEGSSTPFARVGQLPAGHNLVVSENNVMQKCYWHYATQSQTYDYSRPEHTFRDLFFDAVNIRLRGDVPVTLLLSGGLDSSSIAVAASHHAPGELQAFNARFSGFHSDESEYAKLAAQHARIPLTCVDYDAGDFFQDLKQVTWHMDAPVAKGQMLARWSLIREASRRGTILLEGQGADECLGGYPSRHTIPYLRTEYEQAGWGALPGALLRGLCAVSTADNRRVLQGILRGALRGKLGLRNKPMSELFSQRARDEPDYVAGDESGNWHLFDDALTNALQQDHGRLVLPHLLHFGDAISMAHSMESRLPFLDHRLVEFVFGLPFQQKIRGGQAKFILRKGLGADLPKTILARRNKIGFEAPFGNWLRSCFHSEIKPLLCSSTLCNRDIFSDKGLQQLLSQFESTGERALHVLRCASVELWFQQFIDGDGFPG